MHYRHSYLRFFASSLCFLSFAAVTAPCFGGDQGQGSASQQQGDNAQSDTPQDGPKGGDPVDLFTGGFDLDETDLTVGGRGMDVSFIRSYQSGYVANSFLGPRWNLNWFKRIVVEYGMRSVPVYQGPGDINRFLPTTGDGPGAPMPTAPGSGSSATIVRPVLVGAYLYDGTRIDRFDPVNGWRSPKGNFSRLRSFAASTSNPPTFSSFELRTPDGTVYTFDLKNSRTPFDWGRIAVFWLTKVEDRFGNTIRLEYETSNAGWGINYSRPRFLFDTYGRRFDFGYDAQGNLESITDFSGRVVRYEHDAHRNLAAVTLPVGEGSPDGRKFVYRYDSSGEIARRHDLTEIVSSREVADGSMIPYLRNTYDSQHRVIEQFFGGTKGGRVSGGIFRFYYESGALAWDQGIARSRTLVVDPNGDVELHVFSEEGFAVGKIQYSGRLRPEMLFQTGISIESLLEPDHLSIRNTVPGYEAPVQSQYASLPAPPPSFVTKQRFNTEGQILSVEGPESRTEFVYDEASPDRFQQGNCLKTIRRSVPDDGSRPIETWSVYEPLYNQLRAVVDVRGTDPSFQPPDGTTASPQRYLSKTIFDYQEGSLEAGGGGTAPEAIRSMVLGWGINLAQASQWAQFPAGLLPPIAADCFPVDRNGDGVVNQSRGNPIVTVHPAVQGVGAEVLRSFNEFSLLKSVRDEEGFVTAFAYFSEQDPDGDGNEIIPGKSAVMGPEGGGLLSTTTLPEGVQVRVGRDELGRVVERIDGRGFSTRRTIDALEQVVREQNARDYSVIYGYDGNGNLVEKRLDLFAPKLHPVTGMPLDEGREMELPAVVHRYRYDLLNMKIEEDVQASGTQRLVTRHYYDRNRNLVLTLFPEWDADPDNLVSSVLDERGFVLESSRGGVSQVFRGLPGNGDILGALGTQLSSNPPLLSSELRVRGVEGELRFLHDGEGKVAENRFDGFKRKVQSIDPLGNRKIAGYDPQGNARESWIVDAAGVTLHHKKLRHDERGRLYQSDVEVLEPGTIAEGSSTPGDGWITTRTTFDRKGQAVETIDDNLVRHFLVYDGLGRVIDQADSFGSRVQSSYDKNGNLIRIFSVDASSSGALSQIAVTRNFYDELNRLVATTDNLLQTRRFLYDSLGRQVFASDAKSAQTRVLLSSLNLFHEPEHGDLSGLKTNGHGNDAVSEFDDAGRSLATTRFLWSDGLGGGSLDLMQGGGDGKVVTRQEYDRNGRLTAQVDDAGNRTTYLFDSLNRQRGTLFADGTASAVLEFDRRSLVRRLRDPNGTTITNDFDDAGRLWRKTIVAAPEVLGTTQEIFAYDGLGRMIRAENKEGFSTISVVQRQYDALSRCIREDLSYGGATLTTQFLSDGCGNLRRLSYPGAGRVIDLALDGLNRLEAIREGTTTLASYSYVNHRLESRSFGNGTRFEISYDGLRRPSETQHLLVASGGLLDHRRVVWDEQSNKVSRQNLLPGQIHEYSYDSTGQMRLSRRNGETLHDYRLDGVRNRLQVDGQAYGMDEGVPEPADRQMNQITRAPGDPASSSRHYDENGNLRSLPMRFEARYDYKNQMVEYRDVSVSPALVHRYVFDALGRRIAKIVDQFGAGLQETRFVYAGAQIIEERGSSGAVLASYVYGNGIDEVIQMKRGAGVFYYHPDDMGNVVKMTDGSGMVVAAFDYEDFGGRLNQHLGVLGGMPLQNPFYFGGRYYDYESGLYDFRTRMMDPRTGRFTTRDSIGIWGDPRNLGNGYAYCGNNPWSLVDPMGMQAGPPGPCKNPPDPDVLFWQMFQQVMEDLSKVLEKYASATTANGASAQSLSQIAGAMKTISMMASVVLQSAAAKGNPGIMVNESTAQDPSLDIYKAKVKAFDEKFEEEYGYPDEKSIEEAYNELVCSGDCPEGYTLDDFWNDTFVSRAQFRASEMGEAGIGSRPRVVGVSSGMPWWESACYTLGAFSIGAWNEILPANHPIGDWLAEHCYSDYTQAQVYSHGDSMYAGGWAGEAIQAYAGGAAIKAVSKAGWVLKPGAPTSYSWQNMSGGPYVGGGQPWVP